MAERERLTKKERRERSREERKRKEAEAARKRKRDRIRNSAVTLVIVGVVAAVVLQAFLGGQPALDDAIMISSQEAEEARATAGCEVLVERTPLPDRQHYETEAAAPSPDAMYPDIRPTHSGPHTVRTHPVIPDGASRQISEVSSTHNLEHGAVIVWYDPEQVDGSTANDMGDWSALLNANGFQVDRAGTAIFVSPYEDPGISSGKAIAFRAWGTAMDCDAWDETVANAFVAEHYGTRGIAPERTFAPYPEAVLDFADRDLEDSDAPVDGTPLEDMEVDEGETDAGETDDDEADDAAEE